MLAGMRSREAGGRSGFLARRWRPLCVWASALGLLVAALLGGCSLLGPPPLSNDPKNLFALAEPASVMVEANVSARITVPGMLLDQPKIDDALSAKGIDPYSAQASVEWLGIVDDNPILYIDPDYNNLQSVDASSGWWGSGFIADPNGYVVTSADIAGEPDDPIKSRLIDASAQSLVEKEIQAQDWSRGLKLVADTSALNELADATRKWSIHYASFMDLAKQYTVVTGSDVKPKPITATFVTAGEPSPGKDIAILKIEGQNYPTIPIGDDTQSNVGDKLCVIGYPGVASGGENPFVSIDSITEPTFTMGVLSAKKQATRGFQVIQTDAAVDHGSGGGPVLNSRGQVIGIAAFGSPDPSTGQNAPGYNFIMPSTLIKQFLGPSGANPAQGEFTRLYTQGLTEGSSERVQGRERHLPADRRTLGGQSVRAAAHQPRRGRHRRRQEPDG